MSNNRDYKTHARKVAQDLAKHAELTAHYQSMGGGGMRATLPRKPGHATRMRIIAKRDRKAAIAAYQIAVRLGYINQASR